MLPMVRQSYQLRATGITDFCIADGRSRLANDENISTMIKLLKDHQVLAAEMIAELALYRKHTLDQLSIVH